TAARPPRHRFLSFAGQLAPPRTACGDDELRISHPVDRPPGPLLPLPRLPLPASSVRSPRRSAGQHRGRSHPAPPKPARTIAIALWTRLTSPDTRASRPSRHPRVAHRLAYSGNAPRYGHNPGWLPGRPLLLRHPRLPRGWERSRWPLAPPVAA